MAGSENGKLTCYIYRKNHRDLSEPIRRPQCCSLIYYLWCAALSTGKGNLTSFRTSGLILLGLVFLLNFQLLSMLIFNSAIGQAPVV
jgi:hypothetical protein